MRSMRTLAPNNALGTMVVFVCLVSGLLIVAMAGFARHGSTPVLPPNAAHFQSAPLSISYGSLPNSYPAPDQYQAIADAAANGGAVPSYRGQTRAPVMVPQGQPSAGVAKVVAHGGAATAIQATES